MSSYFDYYRRKESDKIEGTCYSMCPDDERKLRESSKLVHVLEVVNSEKKLVKSYCRPAADLHIAVPQLLRPYSVLISTVEYLLFEVTQRTDVPLPVVYDFVNDRLRAVRQDMTVQRLPADECANLLEPMVRFYVYYGYLLNSFPLKDFDPVLNKKYLLECTKWCLNCFDSIEETPERELIDRIAKFLYVTNQGQKLVCDRVLVESLYILCNLDNIHPLYRYIKLSKDLKNAPRLRLAYNLALAGLHGNLVRAIRQLARLCPLGACAAAVCLPALQRRALQVLSHGYHNKRLTVPSDVIARWLRLRDRQEANTICQHYGLAVVGDSVRFDKTEFREDARMHQQQIPDFMREFITSDIFNIFTYTTNK